MLEARTIAVPESRQLDILAQLLEARGGKVVRVPLVSIHDAPDPAPVLRWLRDFIAEPGAVFIILTGEGLRRLLSLAEKHGLREDFIAALGRVSKLCRGPKPNRALAEIGLKGDVAAAAPTTDGVIETLQDMALEGRLVSVQLYGEDPNLKLCGYLERRGARVRTVAPYIYAGRAEEEQVVQLIRALDAGAIDAIAFTSQPQLKRLQEVARKRDLEEVLARGMAKTAVAAVGPVVRDQLEEAGYRVQVMPERAFFMKPLVTAIVRHFE